MALAPGAGTNLDHPFLRRFCEDLADAGYLATRFNFPYRERGANRPDPPAKLEATWRAVISWLRSSHAPSFLAIGGRSMGGRIASRVVAGGDAVSAVLLFAYPLHSPSGTGPPRTSHLPAIEQPVLFVSGSRDALAPLDELREAVRLVRNATLHVLEGADHGFSAPKGSSRSSAELDTEARHVALEWLAALGNRG